MKEMPEGWKLERVSMKNFYDNQNEPGVVYPDFIINRMKILDLMKEMAEALERVTTDHDLRCEDFSGNIENAEEILKKFKEWK